MKKIKRNNFLKFSGAIVLGLIALSSMPFDFIRSKLSVRGNSSVKVSSIKIVQNPNAVKRNSRQDNNG